MSGGALGVTRWAELKRTVGVAAPPEPLGVLVLPRELEQFDLAGHARDLLEIPRVVAIEPPRFGARRLMGPEVVALRQARRLRFPGLPRLVVLYEPRQYHLARALAARHEAELWYARRADADCPPDDLDRDRLASEAAAGTIPVTSRGDPRTENEPLRARMLELGIISHRPFVPGARVGR